MQQTVTMLEYSAMKKPAKLMLLYSTWKTGDEFVLGFRQIEGDAVGFREGRDHENDEAENLRERKREDRPMGNQMPGTVLRVHDVAQAE